MRIGTVTAVRNVGDAVVVDMRLQRAEPVPAKAIASFESPALLGQPDIELSPGYAGRPAARPRARSSPSRGPPSRSRPTRC